MSLKVNAAILVLGLLGVTACGGGTVAEADEGSSGAEVTDTGGTASTTGATSPSTSGATTSATSTPAESGAETSSTSGSSGSSESAGEDSSDSTGVVPGGPAGPGWEACVGLEGEPCTMGGMCLQNSYETVGACSVPCRMDDDCPPVEGGSAEPACLEISFGALACLLDCANGEVCPDDMFCYGGGCLYVGDAPGGGQCPDAELQGTPQSIIGTTVDMSDDLLPTCWYSYEDVAYEFTAEESGWHYFDAEQSASAITLSAYDGCGGEPIACRAGFAQFIAEFWLDLDAGETIVVGVDGSGGYRLDIEFLGDVPDGHCCFGSFEGCEDDTVRDCVCGLSPGCCDDWDPQCATLAEFSCNAECG